MCSIPLHPDNGRQQSRSAAAVAGGMKGGNDRKRSDGSLPDRPARVCLGQPARTTSRCRDYFSGLLVVV